MTQLVDFDYRIQDPEQRKEAFVQWYRWSLINNDCDPALFMTKYLFDRYEHNLEQKLWICWLYGTTYYFPTTWVIWNEYPDFELVGQDKLKLWNDQNYKRLRYQTDTKWNKGHLPEMYTSYREFIFSRGNSQAEVFRSLIKGRDSFDSFNILWDEINTNLHKFGRYSTWFYLQTLKDCAGLNINAPNLMLSDYNGSRSHRNGLCYALGKDEWVDQKLTKDEYAWLEDEAAKLCVLAADLDSSELIIDAADFFKMESCLCSFKKLFRSHHGRYLGYYLDRQGEEIKTVSRDGWNGIDWTPLWDARTEVVGLPELIGPGHDHIHKNKLEQAWNTGIIELPSQENNLGRFIL